MEKLSEDHFSRIIQAYVWEFGNEHAEAGIILEQLKTHWKHKEKYIIQYITDALNHDHDRPHEYTTDDVYEKLQKDAAEWNGEMSGLASTWLM